MAYKTSTTNRDEWIICPRPAPQSKLRMFCFPYAGVGPSIYFPWQVHLPPEVELFVIQSPGREGRFREAPIQTMEIIVREISQAIAKYLDKPFVTFGHSLGALTSFETVRVLRREFGKCPSHFFVSGYRAPQLPDPNSPIHSLPDKLFVEELRFRYDGLPAVILEDQDMLDIFLPAIRADMTVSETYTYVPEIPFDFPLTAYGGIQDSIVNQESLNAWRQQTHGQFRLKMLPGDHFYLQNARTDLLQDVKTTFLGLLK